MTVTTHYVILLTTRGLFVGQLLSVTARTSQQVCDSLQENVLKYSLGFIILLFTSSSQ